METVVAASSFKAIKEQFDNGTTSGLILQEHVCQHVAIIAAADGIVAGSEEPPWLATKKALKATAKHAKKKGSESELTSPGCECCRVTKTVSCVSCLCAAVCVASNGDSESS